MREASSNLTNKYNPQELKFKDGHEIWCSNLTNKYNPQERKKHKWIVFTSSNLTNKYNPQELDVGSPFL